MSLDKRLLEILVCPVTKVPVHRLPGDRLTTLNREIEAGRISYRDGSPVESALDEALMTADGRTIYTVFDGIPVMLEDRGIAANQVAGW